MNPSLGEPERMAARRVLERHWRVEGYTSPNAATYPWQWLWDSCFHALVWAELGDERAVIELERLFSNQSEDGFVPHMNYLPDPTASIEFWGRRGASTITQPPMFGHAIAELTRRGFPVPASTVDAAERGLRFLLGQRRRTSEGLIELVHPWESGCDDSARWDAAIAPPWDRRRWRAHKAHLVTTVPATGGRGASANDEFAVGSIGFNALVAFNALELATVTDSPILVEGAQELNMVIEQRWNAGLRTWVDGGALAESSGRVRTLDAHFALLVVADQGQRDAGFADLVDPEAFGARFGPAGIHRAEPTRDPDTYWRGPAWPQMSYLLWLAASRAGERSVAASIGRSLCDGATVSGWAEYWNPDTATGRGAIPQSWATVALLVGEHD